MAWSDAARAAAAEVRRLHTSARRSKSTMSRPPTDKLARKSIAQDLRVLRSGGPSTQQQHTAEIAVASTRLRNLQRKQLSARAFMRGSGFEPVSVRAVKGKFAKAFMRGSGFK